MRFGYSSAMGGDPGVCRFGGGGSAAPPAPPPPPPAPAQMASNTVQNAGAAQRAAAAMAGGAGFAGTLTNQGGAEGVAVSTAKKELLGQ